MAGGNRRRKGISAVFDARRPEDSVRSRHDQTPGRQRAQKHGSARRGWGPRVRPVVGTEGTGWGAHRRNVWKGNGVSRHLEGEKAETGQTSKHRWGRKNLVGTNKVFRRNIAAVDRRAFGENGKGSASERVSTVGKGQAARGATLVTALKKNTIAKHGGRDQLKNAFGPFPGGFKPRFRQTPRGSATEGALLGRPKGRGRFRGTVSESGRSWGPDKKQKQRSNSMAGRTWGPNQVR